MIELGLDHICSCQHLLYDGKLPWVVLRLNSCVSHSFGGLQQPSMAFGNGVGISHVWNVL